jgi:glycogen debranching enzyme
MPNDDKERKNKHMLDSFLLSFSPRLFFKKSVAAVTLLFFIFDSSVAWTQGGFIAALPGPGDMLAVSESYVPPLVRGLIVDPARPLDFRFIVDSGNGIPARGEIAEQSQRMARYFLAVVTVPENQLWVNLSPFEKDRIVEGQLGETVLGRDMLAQDYVLKQLAASLVYPDKGLGKSFWKEIYSVAHSRFGTTDIPVDVFNKIWIMPDRAEIYEKDNLVYVTGARLKVMLDRDRTASAGNVDQQQENVNEALVRDIMRSVILPVIEKEVNEGKNFAVTRQIYHAAILGKWYREQIRETLVARKYAGQNKVAGVTAPEPGVKEDIYQRYIQAYKKGIFDFIREEPGPDGEVIPRKYFAGGMQFGQIPVTRADAAQISQTEQGQVFAVDWAASPAQSAKAEAPVWWKQENRQYIVEEVAVSALRRQQGDPGIGKFSDIPLYYRETAIPQGVSVMQLMPFYSIRHESPYAPEYLYALNEDLVDWELFIREMSEDDQDAQAILASVKDLLEAPAGTSAEIDFPSVRERNAALSLQVWRLFSSRHLGKDTSLAKDFLEKTQTDPNLSVKLQTFARWKAERESGDRQSNIQQHLFRQWIAFRQFRKAVDQVHAEGGKLLFDIPFFRGKDSVDITASPEYFRGLEEGLSPGLSFLPVVWGDLALWNWDKLKEDKFRLITDPMQFWLDFGFDGARIDALHFAYNIGQDNLEAEPGDALVAAVAKIFNDRQAFVVAEAFNNTFYDIQRHGIVPMDGLYKRISTHDDPRNYHANSVAFIRKVQTAKRELDSLTAGRSSFLALAMGDIHGDKQPLKKEADGHSTWRYRIPLPGDQDYFSRTRFKASDLFRLHELLPDLHRGGYFSLEGASVEVRAALRGVLAMTADSFVQHVERNGKPVVEIWAAGRPSEWFLEQWGRDTFISLPGILLATGRFEEARAVIRSFASFMKDGLIPNRIPDSRHPEWNEYNTVDGPMWFIQAVKKYVEYSGDQAFALEMFPVVRAILTAYEKGVGYDRSKHINAFPANNYNRIYMDPSDALISSPSQATWMDADPNAQGPVTPRNGKAVEINALWYANLRYLVRLLSEVGGQLTEQMKVSMNIEDVEVEASRLQALLLKVKSSFNKKFWNDRPVSADVDEPENLLFDVIEGDSHGGAVRPNMIFAVSHGEDLLSFERQKQVVDAVTRRLLTDKGLRTLDPRDSHYRPRYDTSFQPSPGHPDFHWHKDYAYHQGTVWPWLIGGYVDALAKVLRAQNRPDEDIKREISAVLDPLVRDFLATGSIAEVYDAEPRENGQRSAGGTPSQAWSVSEVFRVLMEYGILPGGIVQAIPDGVDQAQEPVGGIDIKDIVLSGQRNPGRVSFSFDALQSAFRGDFYGLSPVILEVTPVARLSVVLGLTPN